MTNGIELDVQGLPYSKPFYQRKVERGVLGFKAVVAETDVLSYGVGTWVRRQRQRRYSADSVVTVGGRWRGGV
jgi:hypothetical protein